MSRPNWQQCRTAAASIRRTEFAHEAGALLRPRSVLGVVRSRGPLSLVLYVAGGDGLLVWRSPESLTVLQPPGDQRRRPMATGWRAWLLRLAARQWDLVVFITPIVVLSVLTCGAALLVGAGFRAFVPVGLSLVLVLLVHVALLLGCGLVTGLWQFAREFGRAAPAHDELAVALLPGRQWTVVFCHHVERGPVRQLLRLTDQRLQRLLTSDAEEITTELGVRVQSAVVTEKPLWLLRGATTRDTRAAVADWSNRASVFRPRRLPSRLFDNGGFLFWYLAGAAVVIAVLAQIVPSWERAVCLPDCAGHPATFESALRWLLQRLLLTDPYGIAPASREAWTLGWLVSVMSLMGGVVFVAAVRQYSRVRQAVLDAAKRRQNAAQDETRTLLMVVTREERDAVLAAAGRKPEPFTRGNQVIFDLGVVGATRLLLTQVAPGTVSPGAAAITAAALVSTLDLDFIVLVGICYGLKPGKQQYGDVLVCTQLRAIEHRKETEPAGDDPILELDTAADAVAMLAEPAPGGERTVIVRGDYVTPSVKLVNVLQAFEAEWERPPEVHFGPMLSASTLVSARSLRDELAAGQPDAIGGEMEGAGVYAAAAHAKVDWIVVKAICDWGFGKGDTHHHLAAGNAARFVVSAAAAGWFDEPARRGEL